MTSSACRSFGTATIASLVFFTVVAGDCPARGSPADSARAEPAAAPAPRANAETVIAYYFHRTLRCYNCLTIEAYAQEALETLFSQALASGRLVWLPLNIEEEGNKHFEEDFQLEGSSLVLAQKVGDEIVAWQNLPNVWDHLDYKDNFFEYIRTNVNAALAGKIGKSTPEEP